MASTTVPTQESALHSDVLTDITRTVARSQATQAIDVEHQQRIAQDHMRRVVGPDLERTVARKEVREMASQEQARRSSQGAEATIPKEVLNQITADEARSHLHQVTRPPRAPRLPANVESGVILHRTRESLNHLEYFELPTRVKTSDVPRRPLRVATGVH